MLDATSELTVTDLFCGAGGSSDGARRAQLHGETPVTIKLALNHWARAIETHNHNFPATDHDCCDISATDPRRYRRTKILLAGPSCTNHTIAAGRKKYQRGARGTTKDMFEGWGIDPAAEKSRSTMWDVIRFAEHHQYDLIIVENVVEAAQWVLYDAWLLGMKSLGYEHQVVYFNSQFAWPTPQSRDRLYVIFWKQGMRRPNLEFTPPAWCPQCAKNVAAVQSWKRPTQVWGRYDRQYVYCCPQCASIVRPYYFCAANAIDWSLPAPRIGDRAHPLKPKTIARIEAGLRKFAGRAPLLLMTNQEVPGRNLRSVFDPMQTQTTMVPPCLALPPLVIALDQQGGNGGYDYPVSAPFPTQTTNQATGLLIPRTREDRPQDGAEPGPTSTGTPILGLLCETKFAHATNDRTREVSGPWPAQTGQASQALVTVPFLVRLSGQAGEPNGLHALTDPLGTQVAAGSQHALVQPAPFLVSYNRTGGPQSALAALHTVTTVDRHALVAPAELPAVDDCGFRILNPQEIQRAMAFADTYVVLGTQREKIRQLGNAVTPPVMQMLMERCLEVL